MPPGGPRFTGRFDLRIPADAVVQIRQAAAAEGLSISDFARQAIADRISRTLGTGHRDRTARS